MSGYKFAMWVCFLVTKLPTWETWYPAMYPAPVAGYSIATLLATLCRNNRNWT